MNIIRTVEETCKIVDSLSNTRLCTGSSFTNTSERCRNIKSNPGTDLTVGDQRYVLQSHNAAFAIFIEDKNNYSSILDAVYGNLSYLIFLRNIYFVSSYNAAI